MVTALGIDQLGRDSNRVTGPPYTALQHRGDAELPGHFPHVEVAVTVGKAGSPGRDTQVRHLREQVEQLLRHAVAEVLVGRVVAEVRERQDGDGVAGLAVIRPVETGIEQIAQDAHGDHQQQDVARTLKGRHALGTLGEGLGALDALGPDVEHPGEEHRHRESEDEQRDDESDRPVGELQRRKDDVGDLPDHPRADAIDPGDSKDPSPLQLVQEGFHITRLRGQGRHRLRRLIVPLSVLIRTRAPPSPSVKRSDLPGV
jgi:hypothetical protein